MRLKKEWMGFAGIIVVLIGLFVYRSQVSIGDTITLDPVSSDIKVYICGEVKNPGVYTLDHDDRLEELVNLSGGLTKDADVLSINLARKLSDGEKIVVYGMKETVIYQGIDILNFGDEEMISSIAGIGEVIAKRIISYREINGFFNTYEDLMDVEGIGSQKLQSIIEDLSKK